MKFKELLTESEEERKIWKDFYASSGKLGQQIKNMPINQKTEALKLNNIKYLKY
jgi:hypothetical protein